MNKKSLLSAFLTAILMGELVLVSAMRFGTVQASTGDSGIPKPSVAEFTVELVDYSYDVSAVTTTTIDEYTGEEIVTTTPGYHVKNESIEVVIKNQPFSYSVNGTTYHLYYNVRVKGHFGENWNELYGIMDGYTSPRFTVGKFVSGPIQSNSEYTVVSLSASGYSDDTQIDVQVQALVGHDSRVFIDDHPLSPMFIGHDEPAVAFDVAGDWSSTQTIIINEGQTSTPYQESQIEQERIVGAAMAAVVIGAFLGLLIYLIRRK